MTTWTPVEAKIAFLNCAEVERRSLDLCVQKSMTPDTNVYYDELYLLNLFHGTPTGWIEKRIRAFTGAYALVPNNINDGTTIIERWLTTVPSITAMKSLILAGQMALCDPYGDLVNWKNNPLIVPPPC